MSLYYHRTENGAMKYLLRCTECASQTKAATKYTTVLRDAETAGWHLASETCDGDHCPECVASRAAPGHPR